METIGKQSLDRVLGELVAHAMAHDVSPDVARAAESATRRRLGSPSDAITSQAARRAEAYFSAVVRRRVVRRGRSSGRAAARFVVASVVEDLRATGRSEADIWDELQRGWARDVPNELLEEYRLRLCG